MKIEAHGIDGAIAIFLLLIEGIVVGRASVKRAHGTYLHTFLL